MADDAPSLLAALDDLWPLAQKRLTHWRNLPTWLSLQRKYDLKFLRVGQLTVEVPGQLLPDCDNCVELCCTGNDAEVRLRLRDIATLHDHGLDGAIDSRSLPVVDNVKGTRRQMKQTFFADVFPVLKRDATKTCVLLNEDRQCTAWPHWPLSCARYPYAVDATHKVLFLAQGCHSHRTMSADDAPDAIRKLVRAAVDGYNERVKDLIMLHTVLDELHELGLLRHLRLPPSLQNKRPSDENAS